MAHILIEYSANLRDRLDLDVLLAAVHARAAATGVFPLGGMRTRAYEATHYCIADGHADNAFVHVMVRIGHGRDLATRERACDAIFEELCARLSSLSQDQPLGISLEMQEIDPVLTRKKNNLHDYLRARAGSVS